MSSLYWLLSHEALQQRVVRSIREARTPLTARAPRADAAPAGGLPAPLRIENGVATIKVEGVLTPAPDYMAEMYGEANTSYTDLQNSLRIALGDPSVRKIDWVINSPGGSVDGLFTLLDAIEAARESKAKPMVARAIEAQSAAYGIAAAVGTIEAMSRVSAIGSVGVATSGFISGGICGTVVDLTNSESPDKRPNLSTPEGRAVVVSHLDEIAAEFYGTIARGRGITPDAVAKGYGRGASMLAQAALDAGMIDRIDDPRARSARGARTDLTDARTQGTVRASMSADTTPAPTPAEPEKKDEPAPAPADVAPADESEQDEAAPVAPAPAAPAAASASASPAGGMTLTPEEYAEFSALRAERAVRATAERRALITELVALGAERPATAWRDGAPVPRLASEPIEDLRARVAMLRTTAPKAEILPPSSGSGTGEEGLTDFERADAARIKDSDARARFVAQRLERKQKAQ